jgi:hypothetical protein
VALDERLDRRVGALSVGRDGELGGHDCYVGEGDATSCVPVAPSIGNERKK